MKKVIVIAGPTASGKTGLALHLANRLDGEIVSADSRQVYRFMDIGTAKPGPELRSAVIHHCIDICDPDQYFSAGEYSRIARTTVRDILKRDKQPVVAGGSGLYIQALIDGVFSGNYRDPDIRRRLKEEAQQKGLQALYTRLRKQDPDYASRIHENDQRRIVRALEVCEMSGRPVSRIRQEETVPAGFPFRMFGLRWKRDVLYRRIESRVDRMMASGLRDEVEFLLNRGYSLEDNALDSVGYKEMIAHLKGRLSLDEAVDQIKRNTRRYAKRQMTWFRRDPRILWIDLEGDIHWGKVTDQLLHRLKES